MQGQRIHLSCLSLELTKAADDCTWVQVTSTCAGSCAQYKHLHAFFQVQYYGKVVKTVFKNHQCWDRLEVDCNVTDFFPTKNPLPDSDGNQQQIHGSGLLPREPQGFVVNACYSNLSNKQRKWQGVEKGTIWALHFFSSLRTLHFSTWWYKFLSSSLCALKYLWTHGHKVGPFSMNWAGGTISFNRARYTERPSDAHSINQCQHALVLSMLLPPSPRAVSHSAQFWEGKRRKQE